MKDRQGEVTRLLLVGDGGSNWNSREHFFGAAGEAMRRVLVDRARERQAQKRSVDRLWSAARAWLQREMRRPTL